MTFATKARAIELLLWLAATLTVMSAGLARRFSKGEQPRRTAALPLVGAPRMASFSAESVAAAVKTIVDGNVFRRDREPTDSSAIMPAAPVTPRPPRPTLILRGILGGPPWDVVLEGVPGREGNVVVRVGDVVAGLKVRAVRHDSVFLRGPDTSWTLTLRRP